MDSGPICKQKGLSTEETIRVFNLLPAVESEAIVELDLREVLLSNIDIEYDVLSYVWGSYVTSAGLTTSLR